MNSRKYQTAATIVEKLNAQGFQAFFVGGFVRDMILGLDTASADIDIATNALPADISHLFKKTVTVGQHFGVMVVLEQSDQFEVATFRTDSQSTDGRHPDTIAFSCAADDALRRDFTINGLFYNPHTQQTIDYVDGVADIRKKIIRTIGNPMHRFTEDYLRMLRAIRFAARLEFAIEETTWEALTVLAHKITQISVERIFQEISKMLTDPHPDRALLLLEKSGLLAIILPEVQALKGVEQPPDFHPEGDCFIHTVKTLHFLQSPSLTAAWSALLHDIGKPATYCKGADRIRFNNHQQVSATLTRQILLRLKSPKNLVQSVVDCVDNHMNFMNVQKMRLSTLKRFLSRPTIADELELHRADCLASHGNIENYDFLRLKQEVLSLAVLSPPPLLKGNDLIALRFTPGPLFGKILQKVYELQLDEQLKTPQEACEWVELHRKELLDTLL